MISGTHAALPPSSTSRANTTKPFAISMAFALLAIVGGARPASALSMEQALASCKDSVGVPIVRSCMQGKKGDTDFAKCRAAATPRVRACVMAALNAANGRANVPIAMHKDGEPKAAAVAPGNALRRQAFVAPPRTIAPISPPNSSIARSPIRLRSKKLKADADDGSCQSRSPARPLANFYISIAALRARSWDELGMRSRTARRLSVLQRVPAMKCSFIASSSSSGCRNSLWAT